MAGGRYQKSGREGSESGSRVHIITSKVLQYFEGVCDMRLKPINCDQLNFTYAKNNTNDYS